MAEPVVVLGAGPAGLALGWKLAERGLPVVLLEQEEAIGGQSKTVRRGDWRFDLGGHRFFTRYPDVQRAVEELVGDDLLTSARKSVIRLDGRWIRYPLELSDLLRTMALTTSARAGVDYLRARLRARLFGTRDRSFRDWVVNRFGETLYRLYFGTYSEKLWGISPAEISADWAAQRISMLSLAQVAAHLLGRGGERPRTYLEEFAYPRLGIGMIAEQMAERIRARGGRIICGAQVRRLEQEGGRVRRVSFEERGRQQSIACDRVASTIPLPAILAALGSPAPPLASALKFRSIRFLNVALDLPRDSDNSWIYVPEHAYLFFRIQEPRNWSPLMAPEGKTSLILELACDAGDALWSADEEVLLRRSLDQLTELGLLPRGRRDLVRDCFSTYLAQAYPVYDLAYRRRVVAALAIVDGVPNLHTLGRQGLFRYNNMDHSLKMGLLAARCWERPDLDEVVRRVAEEHQPFESAPAPERRPEPGPGR